ncbi:hypothetical protein [Agromyces bauzanensis]
MTPTAPNLELLHELAGALEHDGPVTVGTMFRSPGIRVGDKIVAFLGHHDRLILKLPRVRALALLDAGTVEPVTMGSRTMREWVAVPAEVTHQATFATWLPLTEEALAYVRGAADT